MFERKHFQQKNNACSRISDPLLLAANYLCRRKTTGRRIEELKKIEGEIEGL